MTLAEWLKGLMYQPQVAGILKYVYQKRWFGLVDFILTTNPFSLLVWSNYGWMEFGYMALCMCN